MKVDAIIVGFQKCGTSALHNFLSFHPEIIVSNPKEAHFFSYDYRYNKGNKYYHSFFNSSLKQKSQNIKFIEASPSYIDFKNFKKSTKRIKEYNKNIKIICLVRNPVARAYSAWVMFKKNYDKNPNWYVENQIKLFGYQPEILRRTENEINNFDLFIFNEIKNYDKDIEIEAPILYKGLYFDGINCFEKSFNNFLLIKNEDFLKNTPFFLEKVTRFLDLKYYDWSEFKNKKYFYNEYDLNMSKSTKELLAEFYFEDMENLKNHYDITYS